MGRDRELLDKAETTELEMIEYLRSVALGLNDDLEILKESGTMAPKFYYLTKTGTIAKMSYYPAADFSNPDGEFPLEDCSYELLKHAVKAAGEYLDEKQPLLHFGD